MVLKRVSSFFSLTIFIAGVLFLAACEKIPELERRASSGMSSDRNTKILELRKWLWTCRGDSSAFRVSREQKLPGEMIEDFVDYFRNKGLSSLDSDNSLSILSSAILWKDSGVLLAPISSYLEAKSIECTNGSIPWTKVSVRGIDRGLDIVALKMSTPLPSDLKKYKMWAPRSSEIRADESFFVFSALYPGQMDRTQVQLQPFASQMHTGIDDDLLLFLPPPPEALKGGLLIDSEIRVVGYLLPKQSSLWGVAISVKRADFSVTSILEKGQVPLPFLGLKLRGDVLGVLVQQVEVGSPAYRAGLRVDDRIKKWDAKNLLALTDWQEVSASDIGRTIAVTYERDKKIIETQVKVESVD